MCQIQYISLVQTQRFTTVEDINEPITAGAGFSRAILLDRSHVVTIGLILDCAISWPRCLPNLCPHATPCSTRLTSSSTTLTPRPTQSAPRPTPPYSPSTPCTALRVQAGPPTLTLPSTPLSSPTPTLTPHTAIRSTSPQALERALYPPTTPPNHTPPAPTHSPTVVPPNSSTPAHLMITDHLRRLGTATSV